MADPHETHCPAAVYELVAYAASPVLLADVKSYLRISGTSEDTLTQSLIDEATAWAESYTGRQFRENTWKLLLDEFTDRIDIIKTPVKEITSITNIVSGSPVTIDASTYYLKQLTQLAEVLLADGKDWPTDTDEREQAITVAFTAKVYVQGLDRFKNAVMRLVAYMYENRGDCCECDGDCAISAGVSKVLGQIRITRV